MRKRIPTLLVLIVLLAVIGFGIFLQYMNKKQAESQKISLSPKYQIITNLTQNSVSITWQTDLPAIGSININNNTVKDDRDTLQSKTPRNTHFVTVPDLTAGTHYQFEIRNNDYSFSDQSYQFTTAPETLAEKQLSQQALQPIRGTIINTKNEPENEAIIILNAKDIAPKATFLTISGNFILPLSKLSNSSATDLATIPEKSSATLEIRKGETVSFVQIAIPIKDRTLPAITLGKNENFTALLQLPAASTSPLEFMTKKPDFDLNNDGKINTLDSSLMNEVIAKKQFVPSADFNNDKVVDNNDLQLIINEIK